MTGVDLAAFERELRANVRGRLTFDDVTRGLYATDASYYQIWPVGLLVPESDDDVRAAVHAAARHGVSLLPRGGGTSLAGQAVGASLVVDFSARMNALLELDVAERWVRVQPGIVRDVLNVELRRHGLHFSPDPATANRANVGGMIANNSSGAGSLVYGKTVDHVMEIRALLSDGTELRFGELSEAKVGAICAGEGREAEIYRGLRDIVTKNRDEIVARFPKVMRRVGGYNLDLLADTSCWNLAHLITGSEGTLALVLDAKLHLDPLPAAKALVVVHYDELLAALSVVPFMLSFEPSAVELIDGALIRLALEHPVISRQCDFVHGRPEALLVVEFYGDSAAEVAAKGEAFARAMLAAGPARAAPVLTGVAEQARVWAVRRAGLGLMGTMKGKRKPISFIEDAAVPVEHLAAYIGGVIDLCGRKGVGVTMYAHASVGVLHVKPALDLKDSSDVKLMREISSEAMDLVMRYGGSWSGEHGDGLARSAHLPRFFGPRVYELFREVKALFDPRHLLNPGKIVDAPEPDQNFRFAPPYPRELRVPSHFHFRSEGGFTEAVELCNGTGACRKLHEGTMCPSYMATRDETHTTRGRANALRLAMTGQLGADRLTDPRLAGVLDLCLACKACKAECPSRVDLARLKSEVLQALHDRHGAPLRERLLAGSSDAAARLSGPLAPLANAMQRSAAARALLARIGFERRRSLPAYAKSRYSRWNAKHAPEARGGRRVALFADCFLEHFEPGVGRAADALLRSFGLDVELVSVGCCQRPRISKGFLREARSRGTRTAHALDRWLRAGVPVVVCEPSCASALVDDLPDLFDDEALGRRLANGVSMIDGFLAGLVSDGMRPRLSPAAKKVRIHGHCHQKALFSTDGMKAVLRAVGAEVDEIDAGCCGMAGGFGYEREHYDLSLRIGEDRLFPAIRATDPETLLVANGFSCRHQIADALGRRAVHWVSAFGEA